MSKTTKLIYKKVKVWPVFEHSKLSCNLQCQHPVQLPVQELDAPLLIQLPANAPGKAGEDGPSVWALSATLETQMEFQTLASALASVALQGVSQELEDSSLSFFPYPNLPFK